MVGRHDNGLTKAVHVTNLILMPPKKERLGDRIYGQILEQIASGVLRPGDRLPSESLISRSLSVSRPIVRQALMRLQADGLVTTRKGLGSVVQNTPPEGLTRFSQPDNVAHMLRCLELRMAVEGQAAALAATRHNAAELRQIGRALDAMKEQMQKSGVATAADFEFHLAVARASGNFLFEQVLQSLNDAIRQGMTTALSVTKEGSPERAQRVIDEHRAIYDAIARGDSAGADLAMRYHLDRVRQRVTDSNRDR